MRTRRGWIVACAFAAAAGALPLAVGAVRKPKPSRAPVPAAKRAEFTRVAAAAGRARKRIAIVRAAEPRWRSGVIDSGRAPFPESAFVISNQWQRLVGSRHVNVYAGALGADPRRGVLVVVATPGRTHVYRTAGRSGALRITGASGTTVRAADARSSYMFDASRPRLVRVKGGGG